MSHLSNDEFFLRLSELFDSRRKTGHGSVFLTQKCLIHGSDSNDTVPSLNEPFSDLNPINPLPIIVRATDGKSGLKKEKRGERISLSTIVEADAIDGFFFKYVELCKLGMPGLKKRDRSKRKLKAKKKKGGTGAEEVKKA